FMNLNREQNKTIILVSHDMEHVLKYCDEVIVMENGNVKTQTDVKEFFKHPEWMREIGINPPGIVQLKEALTEKGFDIDPDTFDLDDLVSQVKGQVKTDA
ncbi:MAG: energy-coupling factor transporter ATPase, partial [Erysipelotrichaceae bacterium]|nr:energy-coupling factor transporter ATPase [Erysipelotrichaceae bacterium]